MSKSTKSITFVRYMPLPGVDFITGPCMAAPEVSYKLSLGRFAVNLNHLFCCSKVDSFFLPSLASYYITLKYLDVPIYVKYVRSLLFTERGSNAQPPTVIGLNQVT